MYTASGLTMQINQEEVQQTPNGIKVKDLIKTWRSGIHEVVKIVKTTSGFRTTYSIYFKKVLHDETFKPCGGKALNHCYDGNAVLFDPKNEMRKVLETVKRLKEIDVELSNSKSENRSPVFKVR